MIQAIGLTKHYGSFVALHDLSFESRPGEILALVGPNGAGKTTALKLLVGSLTPTAGQALIGGFDVHHQPVDAKRLLAFVPDQPFLYEQLTVSELLSFIGGMYRMDPANLQRRAEQLLRTFDLEQVAGRQIGQLSYGMKSRLLLLVSLLHEPKAMILDEPFFGLDPQTLRLMKQLLIQRAADGMTIMLSTHQLPIVEDVAHRIAVLSRGRLLALGTWDELKQQHGGQRLEDIFFQLTGAPHRELA